MIEDRGRETVTNVHWKNPAQIVRAAAEQFRTDHWVGQACYVEVMVEKDALSGILGAGLPRAGYSLYSQQGLFEQFGNVRGQQTDCRGGPKMVRKCIYSIWVITIRAGSI